MVATIQGISSGKQVAIYLGSLPHGPSGDEEPHCEIRFRAHTTTLVQNRGNRSHRALQTKNSHLLWNDDCRIDGSLDSLSVPEQPIR